MSPLDDELRAALRSRATAVTPSPDPLAGIERRATRIRRNRVGASVAATALAVAAIAVGAPALQGAIAPRSDVPTIASAEPTRVVETPAPTTSQYALAPEQPWAYRGAPLSELGEGTVETIAREYAVKRGVAESAVQLTPLFGQVYEPSGQAELVFVALVDGVARWGVAQSSEAGPEFLVDEALPDPALALAAALPGDEGIGRLLVVAAPEVGEIQYLPNGTGEFSAMTEVADGVAITPLEGGPGIDLYQVLDRNGAAIVQNAAPDVPDPAGAPETDGDEGPGTEEVPDPPVVEEPVPGDEVQAPLNAVDWPTRGGVSAELYEQALTDFSEAAGVSRDEVGSRLLFAGQRADRVFLLLQGWYGSDARSFAWSFDTRDGSTDSVLQGFTPPGPAVFAAELDGVLVVVPEPTAGQVLYAPDATSELQPVPDQGTEAAVLLDRPAGTAADRLLVLDGNGDPDRPIYRGTVEELLAATA